MKRFQIILLSICIAVSCFAQDPIKLRKRDRKRDVEMVTTAGTMILRLSDSTPLHRDNFLRLVKQHYYDSVIFHRVISGFMIQAGDPDSKNAAPGVAVGNGGPSYTIPAEIRPGLFHVKGALAAARMGDDVNPARNSSGSQFYIVQGKKYTAGQLDSLQQGRLKGRVIPGPARDAYEDMGGTPQLDGSYTIFGMLEKGYDVLDSIASVPTAGQYMNNRPLNDVRILRVRLIKRKNYGEHWVGRLISKTIGY